MRSWVVRPPDGPLRGDVTVPGDKSITHRAYILGAMARGRTVVEKPLRAEDTDNTLAAIRSLGVGASFGEGTVEILSDGAGGLSEPGNVLDLGNSGTGARLLAGLLAGCPFHSVITGDASLRSRPMRRVVEPLRAMGARVDGRQGGWLLPISVRGGGLRGIEYRSAVASAQVKSCVILAALQARGTTRFVEPSLSRDHTERMLRALGVELGNEDGALVIEGGQPVSAGTITVPGDISSAAFLMVAAAVVPGSEVTVRGVGVNPTRTGIIELLRSMGAEVRVRPTGAAGEPIADVTVAGSSGLKACEVPPERIPAIIDELPVAAVAAAAGSGRTVVRGAGELRVKESDRIAATVGMLRSAGVPVEEMEDGFAVSGGGQSGEAAFDSGKDHRIAMASAVLALRAQRPSVIRDTECVATSFPGFVDLMNSLRPGTVTEGD